MFHYLINFLKNLLEKQDIRKYKNNFIYYILFRLLRNRLTNDLKVKIYDFYIYASHKKNKQSHSILRKCDFEDLKELKFLKKISLTNKILFFDCGANFGFYSLFVASIQKNNKVFSFEASSTTFKDLKKNINLNNLQNIQPINLAISETKDLEIFFKESKNDWESSMKSNNFDVLKTTKIKTITLDSFLENKDIIFPEYNIIIKLDIEGNEMNAIRGAKNLLKKYSPMIIIEFSKFITFEDYKILNEFIEENDYIIYDTSYKEINLEIVLKRLRELPNSMFGVGNNFLIKKNSNYQNIIKSIIN